VFPCFDQPDIKAKWVFEAVVSNDWTVISNDEATVADEAGEQIADRMKECANLFAVPESWTNMVSHKHFKFNVTPKISTYIYAIVAGPFDYFEDI
jgi:aminopeptidase N